MTLSLDEVKSRLAVFAEREAHGVSPLYEHLATEAAQDDEVAGLLVAAAPDDARPTLLLAAAHRLIAADPIHPLSRYYPSLGGFDGADGDTWPLFREFLLDRADRARELIASRYTQTNEVRRAALLYPGVSLAAKEAKGKIALLEVGCSAGLLLGIDRFSYRYQCDGGEQLSAGPAKAAVGLHCPMGLEPGAVAPKLPKKLNVGAKIGLDRNPIDAGDEEELAWLEACVWADQPDRIRLLRAAAADQRKAPPELVTGDAVDDLASTAARLPGDLPLVVMTSHTLAYLSDDRRAEFVDRLTALSADRPLWWVTIGSYAAGLRYVLPDRTDLATPDGEQIGLLGVIRFDGGTHRATPLARTAPHGQRMTWLA
ncbi:hypothetical protein CFN78_03130 [Amycolatopsis antarctica]|uniref:DUF2332 domain-containing protein n=1 Tax=Amycolatopsis antarctica TaxID=1854586 RepID=A0A263DA18_9PSEU|nr:DUF2332 domain-containing protein [Amycolatopsis antarctica]OZM75340.1 hypothetical protein CFN78_03130 [Amycolatopsis antarctica]